MRHFTRDRLQNELMLAETPIFKDRAAQAGMVSGYAEKVRSSLASC